MVKIETESKIPTWRRFCLRPFVNSTSEVYLSGIDFGSKISYINAENCRFITTYKAYGRGTQLKQQIENKCIADERPCNTTRKLLLDHCAYGIQKLSICLQLMPQGRQKLQKIAAKIAKNTRFEILPFVLPPIGHFGEKFNIGAQQHLFRYKMASNVCEKVQDLW